MPDGALTLAELGFEPELAGAFEEHRRAGRTPGRVGLHHRIAYDVYTADGLVRASLPGRLRHEAADSTDLPAVGDWVALSADGRGHHAIEAVLPRRTAFVRTIASDGHRASTRQVVAANVDTVLIVSSLVDDLNLRRLERYLVLARESGAAPAFVLTKKDLCPGADALAAAVGQVAVGIPVHVVSNVTGEGVDDLRTYLGPGLTVAALGSSGVGKSALVNRLTGREVQRTGGVRRDGRGRHTTTHRELIPIPGGGLFLDTPGMREIQLADATGGLDEAFEDVAGLAAGCRFGDCAHESEPGCAVREAVDAGTLDPVRLESYRKLERELAAAARRTDARAEAEERRRRARFARWQRRDSW